jgi:hypothetical protein
MQNKSYHVGFLKDGNRVIVQMARSIDQLSCELWRYAGERITTPQLLKSRKDELLAAINKQFKTTFTRIVIQLVDGSDFTAGHIPALDVQEYLEANK